jgi:hypothetical protein
MLNFMVDPHGKAYEVAWQNRAATKLSSVLR